MLGVKKVTFVYSEMNFRNADKERIENILTPLRYYHQFLFVFLVVFH